MTSLKFVNFGSSDNEVLQDLNKWLEENMSTFAVTKIAWTVDEVPPRPPVRDIPSLSIEKLIEMTQGVIDVLEKDGWTQGEFYGEGGTVCMLGAANRAVDAHNQIYGAATVEVEAWAKAITQFFGWASVPHFNDDRSTTYEIVIEKLREFMYDLKGR